MRFFGWVAIVVVMLGLAGCSSKFRTYNGPEVTQILIDKSDRKMFLFNNSEVLKTYDIGLGFAPIGHKQFEGDGKTPEGTYFIDRKNPNSRYHLSVGVSYPNEADKAFAKAAGKSPGGDIFIHGGPNGPITSRDWTLGCIAVSDREIEVIYSMVNPGTPIIIRP